MTIMAQRATAFTDVPHHPVTTAMLVVLFWLAAAVPAAAFHRALDARSASAGAAAAIGSIVLAAYAYTRLGARCAGIANALGAGIAWLVLAVVAEVAIAGRLGHEWHALLGTPDRPLLRSVFLLLWVFAPAVFARGASDDGP